MTDGRTESREFPDEESDLFSVKSYGPQSIPTIEKVPLTKEEIRKRLLLRIAYVVIALTVATIVAWIGLHLAHLSAVENAMMAASDTGRVEVIREALSLLEGDDDATSRAMRLRLRAMLVMAGEDEDPSQITAALSGLPANDDVARESGIAQTYLALAAGDLSAAMEHASRLSVSGDFAAEAARAWAMAAHAVGNVEQALSAARTAVEHRPDSARHVALFAELLARTGDSPAALARIDDLPSDRQNAATRIARARIADRAGTDMDRAAELAQEVLDDEAGTPHEKAWARLLLSRAAAAAGDRVTARGHLDAASEVAPSGDELFTLGLTEAALRIGADHLAQEVARRLPMPLSVDAGRRAQLSAELALARHDPAAAESALAHAPEGARTNLARARLHEMRSRIEPARELYQQAANDPAYRLAAATYLASMELAQGNAAEAASQVEPLLREHPNHPDVVPVAVEAQLGLGSADRAMDLVTPALAQHPRDVRLLAAKAHVQMAREQWEEALATVDEALRIESDDADLHADRGRAAFHLTRHEVAREAYDAALELDANHPAALVGRLELDLIEFEPARGRRILDRIDRAEITSLRVEQLRGRLLVMEIAGQAGIRKLRSALTAHRRDASITMSLGWLYMQSEQYSSAVRTFARLVDEDDSIEAVLARSLAQIRARASNPARSALESLRAGLDESTLEPATRAELHAVLARLAWTDENANLARREARQALELDHRNSEAHLVLADIAAERNEDATREYEAALVGRHPSARPIALLAIREGEVTDAVCEYANRYRRAAPNGQYARAVWRVQRECRLRD